MPFELADHSLKEARLGRDRPAKPAVTSRSEAFMVTFGSCTRTEIGDLEEVGVAEEPGKKRFHIIGYSNGSEIWIIRRAG